MKQFANHLELPQLTQRGFAITKCPSDVWNIISECYNLLLLSDKIAEEAESLKAGIITGVGNTSDLLDLSNLPTIRDIIHDKLRPLHEQWCGHKLENSAVYGIRSYNKGATLVQHVDREATHHISSIIIVDKHFGNANRDWPLDIQDHDGKWHKVYAEPGDMILYESAICSHGRDEVLQCDWFRNFFVHYKLAKWQYTGNQPI